MFNNIDSKLKNLAIVIIVLGICISVIWFCKSCYDYNNNKSFIGSSSNEYLREYTKYEVIAIAGKSGMIYSVVLFVSSIISSFLIYGFGELIERAERIDNRLEKIYYSNNNKNSEHKVSDEENHG